MESVLSCESDDKFDQMTQTGETNSTRTRVMQITHDLAIGGLQRVVVNLCDNIDKTKFDVAVLCLRELGEFAPEVASLGLNVFHLPQKRNGTDYLGFLKVAKILKKEKVDVIHTHNILPFTDGTMGGMLAGVKRIVHTDHARNFPDKWRYMVAEWIMSHFAYKLVGVSQHTTENLIKFEKISPQKTTTIVNGIDGAKYDIAIDKGQKRKELGLKETGPIVGACVRLTEQKGLSYLLEAVQRIKPHFPDISVVVAGEGPLEQRLINQCRDSGIDKNVFFLGPRLDIPEILKLLDIYVLPSVWEGLPMILLEAMAAECPIIASRVGGVPGIIENGLNGSLVEPKNPEALATEITGVLKDRRLRDKYASEGLRVFREKYTVAAMTRQYERLYLGLD